MESTQQARKAVVRAIPMQSHKRRWCGLEKWVEDKKNRSNPDEKHGLPWPDTDVTVTIVDDPKPFDPNANGGFPVEISPETLLMLERDARIAVRVLNGEGGDPAEVVRAKGEAAELARKLEDTRRELAGLSEEAKAFQEISKKQAEAAGAKIASLEQDLDTARAQIASKRVK